MQPFLLLLFVTNISRQRKNTMGMEQDIFKSLKETFVMKIYGQPTDKDVNGLTCKLSVLAASVSTTNGGGTH